MDDDVGLSFDVVLVLSLLFLGTPAVDAPAPPTAAAAAAAADIAAAAAADVRLVRLSTSDRTRWALARTLSTISTAFSLARGERVYSPTTMKN